MANYIFTGDRVYNIQDEGFYIGYFFDKEYWCSYSGGWERDRCIEVDQPEELLDVNDFVLLQSNDSEPSYFKYITNKDEIRQWSQDLLELWKRVGNKYIRLAYKENGKWVLDEHEEL